jgi:hypothetical protein
MDAQTKEFNLGAMPFLLWKLIEESKPSGVEEIDFGRTDLNHEGLITFKNRFGTTRSVLTYYRYPNAESGKSLANLDSPFVRRICSSCRMLSVVRQAGFCIST